jgi:hypothetical protein
VNDDNFGLFLGVFILGMIAGVLLLYFLTKIAGL